MNPGKVVDANPLDSDLRTGPDYNPRTVETHFQFPADRGSFAAATERCFTEEGIPLVGLEPICVSVFRDELVGLFPNDEDARRLSQQSSLLCRFPEKNASDFQLPKLELSDVVHGHCHHGAIMGMADEEATLSKLGLDLQVLDMALCYGAKGSTGDYPEAVVG